MTLQRISKLQELQHAHSINYVALVPGANLVYFTGLHMHLSERPIVALFSAQAEQQPILIAPFFEVGKAQSGPVQLNWKIHSYKDGVPYQSAFDEAAASNGLREKTFGVEPTQMRVLEWNLLARATGLPKQADAAVLIEQLRMRKDTDEIAKMKRAMVLSEEALQATLPKVQAGMTEREVATILVSEMQQRGAHSMAFSPLIQSGLSATNPHGGAGNRVLQNGDLMVMDFGMTLDDYSSDITRTVAIGQPSEALRHIYEVVKLANAAGRAAAKPGVAAQEVDRAARAVIEEAGLGEYFTHRTGHGLGLEGHEAPYMVEGNTLVLQPGMTFTVEPGIYIPGQGGVRIEDDVVITETGCESLTTFTRDLLVVGV
jgi:Xaa-Pro dipeptidase